VRVTDDGGSGPLGLGLGLLAEQPVGDPAAVDPGRGLAGHRANAGIGSLAHVALGNREQLGELAVGAPLAEDELEYRALVRGKWHRPEGSVPPLTTTPFEGWPVGFDRLYGLELLSYSDEEVRAEVQVRDELRQPAGLVHGGVFASIAETMASMATWMAVHEHGLTAQGLSNQTSFLRPIVDGTIHAVARRRHKGRTTWVWEVEISDDEGRLCALVRMTIAVRELPAGAGQAGSRS
jgi:1,4-dihydroxy-2-naphthoyl-CoA hydrolase